MQVKVQGPDLTTLSDLYNDYKTKVPGMLLRTINTTLKTVHVQTQAALRAELNLSAARINKDLKTEKASSKHAMGSVSASGRPVGLTNFGARQLKKGVKVKVYRKGTAALLKHAFIAYGRAGKGEKATLSNRHVFWRKYDGPRRKVDKKMKYGRLPAKYRSPVETRRGPRIEDVLAKPEILNPLTELSARVFVKNLDYQISEVHRRFRK